VTDLPHELFIRAILSPTTYQRPLYPNDIRPADPFAGISYAEFMKAIRSIADRPKMKVTMLNMWVWTTDANGRETIKRVKVRSLEFPGWLH
jgi:hypothetical protein